MYDDCSKKGSDFTHDEARKLAKEYVSSKISLEELAYWAGCSEAVLSRLFFKCIADAVFDETTSEQIVKIIIKGSRTSSAKKIKILAHWEKALFAREVSSKITRLQFFSKQLDRIISNAKTAEERAKVKAKKKEYKAQIKQLEKEKKDILGGSKNG